MTKTLVKLLFSVFLGAAAAALAHAQAGDASYPTRPIRLISPFAPGGSSDTLARLLAAELTKRLGQPVVVENRAGAGGNIGLDAVAKAVPDGYTIGLASPGPLVVNVSLMDSVPYNPLTDFTPIALVADLPIVLVVHNSVQANTVSAFIALDKSNPGKIFYGSAGVGTTMHLSGELFNALAGTRLQHVAYKGAAPAVSDIVAGTVQAGFIDLPSAGPHIASGRLRLLGVGNRKRAQSAPDVPTIVEAGVPGYETSGWFGVVAPAKLPQPIVRRLHQALAEALATPELRARMLQAGIEPTLSTPEQFAEFIRSEIPKWAKVIEQSGAKSSR